MRAFRFVLLLLWFQPLAGCVHVRLNAADLLVPDHRPEAARLAAGYKVEHGIVIDGDLVVGITRAHRVGNRVAILFCGGDSFRRSRDGGDVLEALAVDADVVLFDYPGVGDSTGTPAPEQLVRAGRAVHRYMAGLPDARRQRLIVYGFSLGGLVAPQLAREVQLDALVLEATAPDVASWVKTQVPWYATPFVRVDLDDTLAGVDGVGSLRSFAGPVLLLAGSADRRAPVSLSREFHRKLQDEGVQTELVIVPGAGHGEIYRSDLFRPALHRFLEDL